MCDGLRPDRRAPDVEGEECSALRAWSTSADGAARAATRRRVPGLVRSSLGGGGAHAKNRDHIIGGVLQQSGASAAECSLFNQSGDT